MLHGLARMIRKGLKQSCARVDPILIEVDLRLLVTPFCLDHSRKDAILGLWERGVFVFYITGKSRARRAQQQQVFTTRLDGNIFTCGTQSRGASFAIAANEG